MSLLSRIDEESPGITYLEKKLSRYPFLKSQDTCIYVQKKESMMRRVQEYLVEKKSQDTHV
jgi:hypothetical protein